MPAREGGRRAASPREQGAGKQGSRCRRARRARRKRRVTTWAGGGTIRPPPRREPRAGSFMRGRGLQS